MVRPIKNPAQQEDSVLISQSQKDRAEEFLRVADQFQLGELSTEASHPKTRELASWSKKDLPKAVDCLHQIDLEALEQLKVYLPGILRLHRAIKESLKLQKRIYLCGCGATGRLSLSLEYLWRRRFQSKEPTVDQVRAFMAGGDTALVHSLEGFEDFPEYGKRQLLQMGYQEGDLLISCTEGGETPFVIGATLAAAETKGPPPFFLYCNPEEILEKKVERSRLVLKNTQVDKLNLNVGPMALAGSTRMQASTVLMLAVGLALFAEDESEISRGLLEFTKFFRQTSIHNLIPFIEKESEAYQQNEHILYHVEDYAITLFTDTTERSPTFSLPPFENQNSSHRQHSLSYVIIDSARDARESWMKLLGRSPRPLNWTLESPKSTEEYLLGFDFSRQGEFYRKRDIEGSHHDFYVRAKKNDLEWSLGNIGSQFPLFPSTTSLAELFHHLQLKMLLNTHSTLVMGRLDRYRQNFMTWVKPTNGKLIDRAARYVLLLLKEEGMGTCSYEEVVRELFRQEAILGPKESIVIKAFAALSSKPK
ncbi:MAG: hypothetical protein KDD35_04685 [Bdellovibrionales bacterium]|nr:hypothetical protein [Bdellovibrionales bacterium]